MSPTHLERFNSAVQKFSYTNEDKLAAFIDDALIQGQDGLNAFVDFAVDVYQASDKSKLDILSPVSCVSGFNHDNVVAALEGAGFKVFKNSHGRLTFTPRKQGVIEKFWRDKLTKDIGTDGRTYMQVRAQQGVELKRESKSPSSPRRAKSMVTAKRTARAHTL